MRIRRDLYTTALELFEKDDCGGEQSVSPDTVRWPTCTGCRAFLVAYARPPVDFELPRLLLTLLTRDYLALSCRCDMATGNRASFPIHLRAGRPLVRDAISRHGYMTAGDGDGFDSNRTWTKIIIYYNNIQAPRTHARTRTKTQHPRRERTHSTRSWEKSSPAGRARVSLSDAVRTVGRRQTAASPERVSSSSSVGWTTGVGSGFGAHTPRQSVVLDPSDRPVITANIVLWFWFTVVIRRSSRTGRRHCNPHVVSFQKRVSTPLLHRARLIYHLMYTSLFRNRISAFMFELH